MTQTHLDFEAVQHRLALGRHQLGVGPRQQCREDGAKVAVDLDVCLLQRFVFLLVKLLNDGFNLR